MIIHVKHCHRKVRLVIEEHVLNADDMDMNSSSIKIIPACLLLIIAKTNGYQVLIGDIKNAYVFIHATGWASGSINLMS